MRRGTEGDRTRNISKMRKQCEYELQRQYKLYAAMIIGVVVILWQ